MKKERSKELFSPESCSPVLSGGIRDFTVHGTEPVPLHIYHQDYAHGGLSVPFHWHKELEWIWVEKGTLTLTLKTETRTISEGTFLFINSHELHQLCSIGTTPSVHHALVFLPEILKHLEVGGVVILDDVFQGGDIAKDIMEVRRGQRTIYRGLQRLFEATLDNPGLTASLVPLGDGILMLRKNQAEVELPDFD